MDYRLLGRSGFRVPVLAYGTSLFGSGDQLYKGRGDIDVGLATRLIDICLDHGVNLFDCADAYREGRSEEVLGQAIKGRRNRLFISTKITFPMGAGPNDFGSSRIHLIDAVDQSLRRLEIDHIDLLYLHGQDSFTPVEETLSTLDQLVRDGKVRYVGSSNFEGWHLMKCLAVCDRYGYARFIANQAYYSLLDRDYEWELMRLGADQGVGAVVWSPLAWGRLTGKIRRNSPAREGMRAFDEGAGVPLRSERHFHRIVDVLAEIASEANKTIPQVAINWLLQRPTVASVLVGARNEEQLLDNLGAYGWSLAPEHLKRLDSVSQTFPSYPTWLLRKFPNLYR